MRVLKKFGSYNQRRYSRPWIAVVTSWPTGGKPEVKWGSYLGDDDGGETEIEAQVGDVVRWGQKDGRGGNTEAYWGIVQDDGSILDCEAAGARKHWASRQTTPAENPLAKISDNDLVAEIIRRGLNIQPAEEVV